MKLVLEKSKYFYFRWFTTANGYIRMYLFYYDELGEEKKVKMEQIVSYILSVYTPSFLRVHFRRRASDGPANVLYFRELALTHYVLDTAEIFAFNRKCFLRHGSIRQTLHCRHSPATRHTVSLTYKTMSNACQMMSTWKACCLQGSPLSFFF